MQPVITILTELHPVELIAFDRGPATGEFHSKLQKQHNVRPHHETKLELNEGPACTDGKIIHSCTKKMGFMGSIEHNICQISLKLYSLNFFTSASLKADVKNANSN